MEYNHYDHADPVREQNRVHAMFFGQLGKLKLKLAHHTKRSEINVPIIGYRGYGDRQ